MKKPRLFIGFIFRKLLILQVHVMRCLDRKVERDNLGQNHLILVGDTLTSLTKKSKNVDFALFIFRPEDLTVMRDNPKPTVRDNVIILN